MQLTILHDSNKRPADAGLLPFLMATDHLAQLAYQEYTSSTLLPVRRRTLAVPRNWRVLNPPPGIDLVHCADDAVALRKVKGENQWCVISNGRFATDLRGRRLQHKLAADDCLVAVNVDPDLVGYREKVCLGSRGHLAGFKRIYSNSILPGFLGRDWPHHLCIRASVLDKVLIDGRLPLDFSDFLNVCARHSLTCKCLNVGGNVVDLATEAGVLAVLATRSLRHLSPSAECGRRPGMPPSARFIGDVIAADDVTIGENVLVIGPAILGSGAKVGSGALIRASVIGPGVSVPSQAVIRNRVLTVPPHADIAARPARTAVERTAFRTWPPFSYPRCGKRLADIVLAFVVLALFAPVFPVIALIIKLNSPGPIFFKHKRQGLHGRPFNCLKFRTMIVQADDLQEKLRSRNHVDGPQFMIADDPRVTGAGKFMRNTFIDEIPQFLNVLLGHMSVVGPRPSPEAENRLCPFWRDARLSVRPGITGLWQVRRTRRSGQDFQEWIHYDTEYVRNISFRQDMSICFQTIRKLVTSFANHVQR